MQSIRRASPLLRQLRTSQQPVRRSKFVVSYSAPQQCRHQSSQGQQEATTSATTEPHQPSLEGTGIKGGDTPAQRIKYTTDSYPKLKRDPRFNELTADHVRYFRDLLGSDAAVVDGVTQENPDLDGYNADWMRKFRGKSKLVLLPKSTEQVSQVMKYCNDNMLAVVPQGGNTGLVGGSVPVFDEIVLSLSRMNSVRSFDDISGIFVCDAGMILEKADNYLREQGYIFPLDLGAKGSCHVGGNVATNAGGLRLLRYGSLHGSVLGIEAVLPDGTIVDDLSKLRKNNTGYDIKQLFIGGEGTLGVITGVSILAPQESTAVNVAYFGLSSFAKVQRAFREAKKHLGEILSAFELMDGASQAMFSSVSGTALPLDGAHAFHVLVETRGSNADHDAEKLEAFLELLMGSDVVADGVMAQDGAQQAALWRCREGITETLGHHGGVYKYDLSIPIAQLYDLVVETKKRMLDKGLLGEGKPVVDVVGYGHMGDGNLHLNIATRGWDKDVEAVLEPFVYEWVGERQGSISAEHGLGLAKKDYVGYSKSPTMIRLMKQLKDLYDPNGIMNPYKYI